MILGDEIEREKTEIAEKARELKTLANEFIKKHNVNMDIHPVKIESNTILGLDSFVAIRIIVSK